MGRPWTEQGLTRAAVFSFFLSSMPFAELRRQVNSRVIGFGGHLHGNGGAGESPPGMSRRVIRLSCWAG